MEEDEPILGILRERLRDVLEASGVATSGNVRSYTEGGRQQRKAKKSADNKPVSFLLAVHRNRLLPGSVD